jgi:hypothetical protein
MNKFMNYKQKLLIALELQRKHYEFNNQDFLKK